jgi:hypothetical protein
MAWTTSSRRPPKRGWIVVTNIHPVSDTHLRLGLYRDGLLDLTRW